MDKLSISKAAYQDLDLPQTKALPPTIHPTFSIHKVEDLSIDEGIWVYFEVEDVDNYIKGIVEKGIEVEELPNEKPWLWRESRLKDPDNHQIIIYHAGDNRINPPWRLL